MRVAPSRDSRAKMWRWMVLWRVSTLLAVTATLDFRFFNQRRPTLAPTAPAAQVNCFEYVVPNMNDRFGRAIDKGWRPQQKANVFPSSTAATYMDPLLNTNEISRRIDFLLPDAQDIVKEHAKLVQDINSLRQVVFVSPIIDDNRDYDDSIFHEIIETSTTTTQRPTTTRPIPRPTKSTLPVILVGGASQRQVVKTPPIRYPKPTISLVGTSISPMMKHPYPFVMQEPGRKPIKVCMTAMPMMYPTTRRPSLWQRILHSLIPR